MGGNLDWTREETDGLVFDIKGEGVKSTPLQIQKHFSQISESLTETFKTSEMTFIPSNQIVKVMNDIKEFLMLLEILQMKYNKNTTQSVDTIIQAVRNISLSEGPEIEEIVIEKIPKSISELILQDKPMVKIPYYMETVDLHKLLGTYIPNINSLSEDNESLSSFIEACTSMAITGERKQIPNSLQRKSELEIMMHVIIGIILEDIENLKEYIILDTETNSFYSKSRKNSGLPIQIAYVRVRAKDFAIVGGDSFYIKQDYIDNGATEIHGISKEMLDKDITLKGSDVLTNSDAYKRITPVIHNGRNVLVMHNSTFDTGVLDRFARKVAYDMNSNDPTIKRLNGSICTLKCAKRLDKEQGVKEDSYKLGDLISLRCPNWESKTKEIVENVFGNVDIDFHDARYDVASTYLLLQDLAERGLFN